MPKKEPFTIAVPDATLADLRDRLARTRFPPRLRQLQVGIRHQYRLSAGTRRVLAYEIRLAQARARDEFICELQDRDRRIPIHFIHEPGKGPNPTPLILTHGWPWTFWDLHKVIRPLTDPAAFGGDPKDSFDVVVPSLPG